MINILHFKCMTHLDPVLKNILKRVNNILFRPLVKLSMCQSLQMMSLGLHANADELRRQESQKVPV